MGLPGPHPRSRIHPPDRAGPLHRRLHGQLGVATSFPASSAAPATGRASRPAGAAASRKRTRPSPSRWRSAGSKRVAADFKDDDRVRACPRRGAEERQAHRLRRRRPGVADGGARPGAAGLRRSRCSTATPRPAASSARRSRAFACPKSVIDEETGYILDLGVEFRGGAAHRLDEGAAGRKAATRSSSAAARRAGATSTCPGRQEAAANIHIGIDWLASVSFGHVTSDRPARHRARRRQHRDGLLPLGAPPRRRRRQGDRALGFDEMKASPWEKEDAMHEGIPILNLPRAEGLPARRRQAHRHELRDGRGGVRRQGPAQPGAHRRARCRSSPCDEVLVAVGQENAFPWIERDSGIAFDEWGLPVLDKSHLPVDRCRTCSSAATPRSGPKNIITAVAHGHEAAVSIDRLLHGEDVDAASRAARAT